MAAEEFKQKKQKLRILILGAYRPENASKKLERLRNCLIKRGFKSTKLAKEFMDTTLYGQDMDEHFTIKSRKLIEEWAHVPIFVFFKKADNQGVASEITYTCLQLHDKQSCCAVFFEDKLANFSTQIKGSIKITRQISYEIFKNEKELCDLAAGHVSKTLDKIFYFIE
jgi:hypothetical protein